MKKFLTWLFTSKHTRQMIDQGFTKCKSCGTWVKGLADEERITCLTCWYSRFLGVSLVAGGDLAKYGILSSLKEK